MLENRNFEKGISLFVLPFIIKAQFFFVFFFSQKIYIRKHYYTITLLHLIQEIFHL